MTWRSILGRGVSRKVQAWTLPGWLWPSRKRAESPGDRGPAFTIAVVSLCAKMSKADGISLPIEADAFERLFKFAPSEMKRVRTVFDRAKEDVAGFESYASDIASELASDRGVKETLLEALFHIAVADEIIHEAESRFLERVAEIFGFSPIEYRAIRARFVHDTNNPYVVLGIAHDVTNERLKAHYRALVRDNHPDVLIGRGVPPEFVKLAQERLAAINAAYDQVARERGL